jgi:hypothetical protein
MGEVFDTDLSAAHFSDADGNPLPIRSLRVETGEVLDPEAIQAVDPEEQFEGYTGNAGMTMDHWYRHAAIFLWPDRKHFAVLCDAGTHSAVEALGQLVGQWRKSGQKDEALRAQGVEFAAAILGRWGEHPHSSWRGFEAGAKPCALFESLAALDEPRLIRAYLAEVMTRDAAVDPGKPLLNVLKRHGWASFQPELEAVFRITTVATLERNVQLLGHISSANPRKREEWLKLCGALAEAAVGAVEAVDQIKAETDYRLRGLNRVRLLTALAQALLAAGRGPLLARLVTHTLARPGEYPLVAAHLAALTDLGPWVKKNLKKPCPALAGWVGACRGQLEALTGQAPKPFADLRRPAALTCRCEDCAGLKRFLEDPREEVHRVRAIQHRRTHLEEVISRHQCDLDLTTESAGGPRTPSSAPRTARRTRQSSRRFTSTSNTWRRSARSRPACRTEGPRSLGRELVNRRLGVGLAGPEDGGGEALLVGRVGEVLRLQAEAGVLAVAGAALALELAVEGVGRVELYPRLGGEHRQHPPGPGLAHARRQAGRLLAGLVEHEVDVVAAWPRL